MKNFEAYTLRLREVFGNQDSLYKVPKYQRPYRWSDEQVEELWSDLFEAFEEGEKSYFLGSIVVAQNRDYKEVIDGQQRLTTLMIFFSVVKDLFNEKRRKIESLIFDLDDRLRLTLTTHAPYQNSFEKLIKGELCYTKKPTKKEILKDDEPYFKFINTAYIFANKFKNLNREKALEFIEYILNNVYMIRIDCENTAFAIKLFQVINDRGLDLTNADLIKSFLIGKVEEKYNIKEKEDEFISHWQSIEELIKQSDISINDLFILYEYYALASNPKKSLYEEIKKVFEDIDPIDAVVDVKKMAKFYLEKFYNNEDKIITSLRYLRWGHYVRSIIMSAYMVGFEEKEELFKEIRKFFYLYWISGYTLNKVKHLSFKLIELIKGKDLEKIKEFLEEKIKKDRVIEYAKENLNYEYIDSFAWIKPVLLLIEHNRDDSEVYPYLSLKNIHLEHILPLGFEKSKGWSEIDKKEAEKVIYSVGNLTLLKGSKNISASNEDFEIKKKIYGGKKDKMTSFKITEELLNYEKWGIDEIKERKSRLIKELEEILEI